jgi:transposase
MRIHGSSELLEYRRHRALALLDEGNSLSEVGRLMDCAPSSVMRWRNVRRSGGEEALKVRVSSGRPVKLQAKYKERLLKILSKGAIARGYGTDLWTTHRIAEVIQNEFAVTYHRAHVGRLMHSLGWTHQKPERRALERDEDKINQWKKKTWPNLKKNVTTQAQVGTRSHGIK